MTTTRWIVELLDEEGNTTGHLFDDPERLGDFVRVNAADATQLRIVQTNDDLITAQAWQEIDSNLVEAMS